MDECQFMESPVDLKKSDRYNGTPQRTLSRLSKELSITYADSSEDEVFCGPITPKEMKNDAILRGLRRTHHFAPRSGDTMESKNCHLSATSNTIAIKSPRIGSAQKTDERVKGVEALLVSVDDSTESETCYPNSMSSLQDAMTMLTFATDNNDISTSEVVQYQKLDEISTISDSILSESQMSPLEKQFGRELQNKSDFSQIGDRMSAITPKNITIPRMSLDSLDLGLDVPDDDNKENSRLTENNLVFRSSFHFPMKETCEVNDQCDNYIENEPNNELLDVSNFQIGCSNADIPQLASLFDRITGNPEFNAANNEDVFDQTPEHEPGTLEFEAMEKPEASYEEDEHVSYYSAISSVDQLMPTPNEFPEGLVLIKEQQKVEHPCEIVDVMERKCQLRQAERKPVSPRCSPNIAKLAMPKRVTPKKQTTPRVTPKQDLLKTQLPPSRKPVTVATSHIAKYIKNNEVVTPQIKQIRANDGRSVSKIQKRFPSKLPVPKYKSGQKARSSSRRISNSTAGKDASSNAMTEEDILEEMKNLWDKYDKMFDNDAKALIMEEIKSLKEKFVQLSSRRESILPVAECSYVLPEGSYTASCALALDEKNWDVVTKMHTHQNMQSKRGFPTPPLQPFVLKHTGNRKRIKWVPGLATAAMKKSSPTNIHGVAPPILLSRKVECHNPAFMDASSLEASVVFQIPPA